MWVCSAANCAFIGCKWNNQVSADANGTCTTVPTTKWPSCCTHSCTPSAINSRQSSLSLSVDRTRHAHLLLLPGARGQGQGGHGRLSHSKCHRYLLQTRMIQLPKHNSSKAPKGQIVKLNVQYCLFSFKIVFNFRELSTIGSYCCACHDSGI